MTDNSLKVIILHQAGTLQIVFGTDGLKAAGV
jgi:hypothetical protein